MGKIRRYGLWAVALYSMFDGIREFDKATNWLQLVRGLLWIVFSGFVIWQIPVETDKPHD